MKTTLSILCVVGTILLSFGQDKNFDLSRYKFPDYKRHELEFYFSSEGISDSYYSEYLNPNNPIPSRYDRSRFNMNSNMHLTYNYQYFTRKSIIKHIISINGNMNYIKTRDFDELTKETSPSINLTTEGFKRNYLTENKVFIEGTYNNYFSASSRKISISNNTNDDINKSNSFKVSAGFGAGIGRIEQVGDYYQGYYILQKFNNQKLLNRVLLDNDVFEFASLISQLKNKRFFDYRLRRIAELNALDSLLTKQGLIEKNDIAYFTTLNDYWSFGHFWERKSGRELKLNISPELSGNHYSSTGYSESPLKTQLLSKLQLDCSKQLNLYWERNSHIELSNSTILTKNADVGKNYPRNFINVASSFGFGFFPNSRTKLTSEISYHGVEYSYLENSSYDKFWSNSFSLFFETSYFISPQLQLNANFSGNYWISNHNSTESHNFNYNLGLRYAIF